MAAESALPKWRRVASVALLVGALAAGAQVLFRQPREVTASWLLTHLDRPRLVALHWRVPHAPGARHMAETGSSYFAVGAAPEVAPPQLLHLPDKVKAIEMTCVFALDNGDRVRTIRWLALSAATHQTVDLDTCHD